MKSRKDKLSIAAIILVLVICTTMAASPLGINETHAGHRWEYNLQRVAGLASAFAEGSSGRWLKSFSYGWGYPLFVYTGPLPYVLGALFHLAGLSVVQAVNLVWFLGFYLAAISMFVCLLPIFGAWGALFAASSYVLAPYHLVDVYVRTNFGESFAFCLLPPLLYSVWLSRQKGRKSVLLGAIVVASIVYCHLLSAFLTAIVFSVFSLAYAALLKKEQRRRALVNCFLIAALGLGLSAFFWLPAVFDLEYVWGAPKLAEGYYDYRRHFILPTQLISEYWGYGISLPGPNDTMPFPLGLWPAAFFVCCFVLSLVARLFAGLDARQKEVFRFVLALVVAGFFAVFMTLPLSGFVWQASDRLALVQFPWRFLLPATFCLSAFLGSFPFWLGVWRHKVPGLLPSASVLMSFWLAYVHQPFCQISNLESFADADLSAEVMAEKGIYTTNHLEFMPKSVRRKPERTYSQDLFVFMEIGRKIDSSRLRDVRSGNGWIDVELSPGRAGNLYVSQHYYPAWQLEVNGVSQVLEASAVHPFAPFQIAIPEEALKLKFRFGLTKSARIGWLITALSVLVILGFAKKCFSSG